MDKRSSQTGKTPAPSNNGKQNNNTTAVSKTVVEKTVISDSVDKNKAIAAVDHKLANRPPVDKLIDTNILRGDPTQTSSVLHTAADLLAKAKTSDILDVKLQMRPQPSQLEHIIHPDQANTKLDQKTVAAKIEEKIGSRPEAENLVDRHILLQNPSQVPAPLHAAKASLDKANITSFLEQKLETQVTGPATTSIDRKQSGVVDHNLPRVPVAEKLEQKLQQRPTEDELQRLNILKSGGIAMSIQDASEALRRAVTEDTVSRLLKSRAAPESLIEQGILKDTSVSPAILKAQQDLELAIRKDVLRQSVEGRKTVEELIQANILPSANVAPSLSQAATTLEKQMKEDTISKHIRRTSGTGN